ncbi:hypothetical protein BDP27DRAFT_960994 [Rhodocollybia butyracea]|uniref:C2H2-type domain-containing protein n=1 Tax=Rhodocollybia butyracea TaxID=206335 RepID=A0A9P5Q740_9AGAR|nr:hypothetical protein BDP27DRAFT_960994 [Rhodocollybia butyracea]
MSHIGDTPLSPAIEEAIFRLEKLQERLTLAERMREDTSSPSQQSHGNTLPSISDAGLSKFTGTTATFSWPALMPSSRLEEPRMFRKLEETLSARSQPRTSPTSSSRTSPGPTSSECTSPISDSSSVKRRRSDDEDDGEAGDVVHGSEKTLGGTRIIRTRKELFNDTRPTPLATSDIAPSYSPPRKKQSPRKSQPRRITTNFSSGAESDAVATSPSSSVDPFENLRKSNWERFAEYREDAFHCLWRGCYEYAAKKQLVKRHIETTHMKLKPFACSYCDRRFPQKTSLNVHVASKHTRDNPYKCPFEGCVKAYNDPARLHRHKIDVHNYVPKTTIRCKKKAKVSTGASDYEAVPFSVSLPSRSL